MKKILFILPLVLIAILAFKPHVSFENIDWLKKQVSYKMSILFTSISGIKKLSDASTTTRNVFGYSLNASSEGGKIILAIMKSRKILKGIVIDFKTQTYSNI